MQEFIISATILYVSGVSADPALHMEYGKKQQDREGLFISDNIYVWNKVYVLSLGYLF